MHLTTRPTLAVTAVGTALAAVVSAGLLSQAGAAEPTTYVTVTPGSEQLVTTETRATGHVDFLRQGLHVYTEGTTSTDKAAGYIAVDQPLAGVGEPTLDWRLTSPSIPAVPGKQLVVDFDGDGAFDGILVGEPVYGDDWWLSNSAAQFVKDGAPVTGGGSGSAWHGTLDQWRASFADADVDAVGFSLGSGVRGDGVVLSMTLGDTGYEFSSVEPVVEPVPDVVDAVGRVTRDVTGLKVTVDLSADELPEGAVEGAPVRWLIRVDGRVATRLTTHAGDDATWVERFAPKTGRHVVDVVQNGELVRSFAVLTGRR